MKPTNFHSGRGAQINTANRFLKDSYGRDHAEGIDDWTDKPAATKYIEQEAKSIVNAVESPDLPMDYSMNPYAGCEHGCIYCYARNVHEYWGYSAGLDFEQQIIVKKNAPQLLRKFLSKPGWHCTPIMLSGNTDCYQPAEQRYRLTRAMLEVCHAFNQPVGIVTKNARIEEDLDILREMAKRNTVSVMFSITSADESLRRVMEPRTTTQKRKMEVMEKLSQAGIRTGVLIGPVIPGLNDHEIPGILSAAKTHGASFAAYTFVRLNGAVKLLFHDWLYKVFPDRADKIWHSIEAGHGGQVSDSRWGTRMRGEGKVADLVAQQFRKYRQKLELDGADWRFNTREFMVPGAQGKLFN